MAGVQTNSLAMVLQCSIRLGGSGSLQAISLFRQTSRKNSLNLIMYAEISPAGSKIDATVDRMTALVHSKVSLRARFSERRRRLLYTPFLPLFPRKAFGRKVLGRKVKVSPTGLHLWQSKIPTAFLQASALVTAGLQMSGW